MKMLISGNWPAAYMAQVTEAHPDVTFVIAPTQAEALQEVKDADAIFGQPGRDVILGWEAAEVDPVAERGL